MRLEDKIVYIYFLHYGDGVPFYVGKSVNPKSRCVCKHRANFGLNTQFEVIDETINKEWKFWETHYIALFKTWGFNLKNKNKGGGGANIGVKFSEERNRKISIANKGKSHSNKGRPFTEEHKAKIKATRGFLKGRKNTWKDKLGKPVIQYDLEGNLIQEFSSVYAANEFLKVKNPDRNGQVGRCANGYNQTAYNFKWKFKNEEDIILH